MRGLSSWARIGSVLAVGVWLSWPAYALDPLKNVPADLVEIVQEAREWRYKQLDPRLAELGDRAMQAYFDAGMPEDPAAVEALMRKIDAREFMADAEASLRDGGRYLRPEKKIKIEEILANARREGGFSLFDAGNVADILNADTGVLARPLGALRELSIRRFPWGLMVPSAHAHPEPKLNDAYSHHFMEIEILVPENHPGQNKVDVYDINDIEGFAGHDGLHGEDMFGVIGMDPYREPKTLKEALVLEIQKSRILHYGRAHPEILGPRSFDLEWFSYLHEYPKAGRGVMNHAVFVPESRYGDVLLHAKVFGFDSGIDFESGVQLLRLLESANPGSRSQGAQLLLRHIRRADIMGRVDVRRLLLKNVAKFGEEGAARLLVERPLSFLELAQAFPERVDLQVAAWNRLTEVALRERASRLDLRSWVGDALEAGYGVRNPYLMEVIRRSELLRTEPRILKLLRKHGRLTELSVVHGDCVRRRLIETIPWITMGAAGYGLWELLNR